MININRITESLFYVMLLSPLLSYVTFGLLGLLSIQKYFMVIVIIYGTVLTLIKFRNIEIHGFIILSFLWFLYTFTWAFFNDFIQDRGLLRVLFNKELAVFFALIVIYNTKFSDQFIRVSVSVFKITVITTVVFSVWQVFDSGFFNAWDLWRDDNSINADDIYSFRRASLYGFIDQNALGLSFLPLLSVLVGYLMKYKYNSISFFLLIGAIVSFVSNTRYIMIAFIILTLQIIIANKENYKGILKSTSAIIIISIVSFLGLQYLGYDINTWYQQRLFSEGSIEESTRYAAFINFAVFFPDNYLFGNGSIMHPDVVNASAAFRSSHIHIGYLSHLVAYGVAGCIFLFGFWAFLAKKLYSTAVITNYWGSLFGFFVFLFAFSTMSQSSVFYYGLLYVFIFDKYYSDKYT